MFPIQNGLRSTSRLSGIVARSYCNTIVSAPPKVKLSTGENIFAFFCIASSMLIWPMYFAPNFKHWAQPKGA